MTSFWKALFFISSLIILPWGIVTDSLTKVIAGLGILIISTLIE